MYRFVFLAAAILWGCSRYEPVESLGEYDYPIDSIGNGKLFTFERTPEGETLGVKLTLGEENGNQFLIERGYTNGQLYYERKYEITKSHRQLTEWYFYSSYDTLGKVKGEIIEFRNVEDDTKYKGLKIKARFVTDDNTKSVFNSRETFQKDTAFRWGDTIVPALKFSTTSTMGTNHAYIPLFGEEEKYTGEAFVAKGIGLIQYSTNSEDEAYVWNLVKIENL
jgi:hypothetical protein